MAGAAESAHTSVPPDVLLGVLHRVCELLLDSAQQERTLGRILAELNKTLNLQRGTITLLSVDGAELRVEEAHEAPLGEEQPVRFRRGEGLTGKVLETGQPVVVDRLDRDPAFLNRLHRRDLASVEPVGFICVPIKIAGEVIGTLAVDVPHPASELLNRSQQLLSIVASMIAHDVLRRRTAEVERLRLEAENQRMREAVGEHARPENMVGDSSAMHDVFCRIRQVAPCPTTVIVRGESGTGKELVATAVHYLSHRATRPFIKVNCAALNEQLLESELFGHERGAFTGALQTRIGRIEQAEGGTLFLDEIGEFSLAVQVKLLRMLQEREFERVGSNTTIKADVRIIAATNSNLEQLVSDKKFREDLYYRIHVFPIYLPPLRDRKSDILSLANVFAAKYAKRQGKYIDRISTPAIEALLAYHWPGNVRELENCIEYAVLLSSDGVIHGHNLPPTLQMPKSLPAAERTLRSQVEALERDVVMDTLKRHGGSISSAAGELGITPRMVRYKIKSLGIDYTRLFKRA